MKPMSQDEFVNAMMEERDMKKKEHERQLKGYLSDQCLDSRFKMSNKRKSR